MGKKESNEVIMGLITLGGQQLIMKKDKSGSTALHYACKFKVPIETVIILIYMAVRVGIEQQLVMEEDNFGFTALYYARFFESSDEVIRMLEICSDTTSDDAETKEIFKTSIESIPTAHQQCSFLHVAIKYGMEWSLIKELVALNVHYVMNEYDSSTGMHQFMVAASRSDHRSDLSSIYGLMRMAPVFS